MKTFGSKPHQVGKENLTDVVCSFCGQKGTVDLYIFYRYYHLFGIPLLPHRKGGAIMCSNCKHVTNAKLFTIDLKERYTEQRKKYKAPVWQYFGSVIFSVLLVSFIVIRLITYGTVSTNKFLKGIQPDNIYKYAITRTRYTFWKINRVNNDSVYYVPSNYEFSGTPPKEIDFDKIDFFDSTERLYLKSEFKVDFESKKIKKYK